MARFCFRKIYKNMAAIFDMDGLLLDTDPSIWVESMHEVAASYNISVTNDLLKHTRGLRIYEVTEFWNAYFEWNNSAKAHQIAEEILDAVIVKAHQKGKVLPGVIEILNAMQAADIPLGLATSSPQRLVDDLLQFFNLKHFFKVISTADHCGSGKPHPEVYLNSASALGVVPWRTVAFEDSVNGMVAAKAARMFVVAVPETAHFEDKQFGLADLKLHSLADFNIADYHKLLAI